MKTENIQKIIVEQGYYSEEENLRIFLKFFKPRYRHYSHSYLHHVFKKYNLDKRKVLDIGCQYGQFHIHFSDESVGVDVDEYAIKFAKSIGLNVINTNIEKGLPFKDKTFDVVFCSHVLEHIFSPHLLLLEIWRVLKDDGIIILYVPRFSNYFLVSKLFTDYLSCDHVNAFTIGTLSFFLERAGFRILEKRGFIYSFPKWFNIVFKPLLNITSNQILAVGIRINDFAHPKYEQEVPSQIFQKFERTRLRFRKRVVK